MGGKKKLSLKQMERTVKKKDKLQKREKKSSVAPSERKAPEITPPDLRNEKVISEIRKMKALTPYVVASRFNLRLSIARDMLEELAQRGIIEYVSGSKYLKIYKPHD